MEAFRDKVICQIYPRSFMDSDGDSVGDLRGIIKKLDYLKELGVSFLWLTPVFPSPQKDNGYDVADYCAIDPRFGTMADMVTVGEMSSTHLEDCIQYSYQGAGQRELSMCFHFHHLKVDYKDGDKWALMEPDRMALKKLFEEWQVGMERGNGWNALFWCNHDQPRIVSRMGHEGKHWKASAKMLAAAIHLMRGTPYIYQGEEIGMTNPHFDRIDQYRDVESLNYYRILLEKGKTKREALEILAARSRDNSRTPMQWRGEKNGGFTHGEPWIETADNVREINAEDQVGDPDSVYGFYKELIRLWKERDVIAKGSIAFFERENPDVLAYTRDYEGKRLTVICNLTARAREVWAKKEWEEQEKILGNYEGRMVEGGRLKLREYEVLVLGGEP